MRSRAVTVDFFVFTNGELGQMRAHGIIDKLEDVVRLSPPRSLYSMG